VRARNALGFLARDKAGFDAISAFSPDALRGVIACRKAARSGAPAMAGFEGMLRELAERGFVAIPKCSDPRAAVASFYNVSGVVLKNSFAPGVPPAAWESGSSDVVLGRASRASLRALQGEMGSILGVSPRSNPHLLRPLPPGTPLPCLRTAAGNGL